MNTDIKKQVQKNIKGQVQAFYGGIAKKVSDGNKGSCGCGPDCCSGPVDKDSQKLYTKEYLDGLPLDAVNASLGCANPLMLANLQKGEIVLDLGSGGGIDAFISSKYVGEEGMVYGLDMTDEMIELANSNKKTMGVRNVKFLKGFIEEIPLDNNTIDVILSNCVINLSDNKELVLKEAFRVLKHGGRLAIADIIQLKEVPDQIVENIRLWVGCIAGAMSEDEYSSALTAAGFKDIEITPVNPYSAEFLRAMAREKNEGSIFDGLDSGLLDGAFAGAHVKARKL